METLGRASLSTLWKPGWDVRMDRTSWRWLSRVGTEGSASEPSESTTNSGNSFASSLGLSDTSTMADRTNGPRSSGLHHVELWVPNLDRVTASWGWLLETVGHQPLQKWTNGESWEGGSNYVVIEQSPALTAAEHDRCRPGLNHLAFHGGSR